MKAMALTAPGGIDQLKMIEITPRDPAPGEIQVAVKATSLNFKYNNYKWGVASNWASRK